MDIYGNPVEGEGLTNGGTIDGNLDINGNVVIDGDLTVNGTITSVDEIEVKDAIITIAVDNPADLVNSGLIMARNNNTQYAGLVRSAAGGGRFKLIGAMPAIETGSLLVPNGSMDLVDIGFTSGMFWDQGHEIKNVAGNLELVSAAEMKLDASDIICTGDLTLPANGDLKWASGNHLIRELGTSLQISSNGNLVANPQGSLLLSSPASASMSSTTFASVIGNSSVRLTSNAGSVLLQSSTGVVVNDGVNSYTLPTVRGAAGQVLTDSLGDGVLSWEDSGGGGGNFVATDDPLEQTMIGPLKLENAGVKQSVTCGNAFCEQLTVSNLAVPLTTGAVDIGSSLGGRFRDLYITSADVSGSMTLNSSSPQSYTLPSVRGSAGQVLTDVLGNGALSWEDDDSGGDVQGPASATDNGLALFDGTTGKLLKDSPATLSSDGELGIIGNLARVNLDNFGSEWGLRNQGFFELYKRDSPNIGGGNPEVVLTTQSGRVNIFRPTWVQNSLTVNAGIDSYELPTTRPIAGQVLTATSTTTSSWQDVASAQQIFTLAFGGNINNQNQRFLLFNGSSNIASTANIDIQSTQFMIKDTYLVGASFVRENVSANTTFIVSVESSPGSGILVDQNLFTMTAVSNTQVAKTIFGAPILLGGDRRIAISSQSTVASPQNCLCTLYLSFQNDVLPATFSAPVSSTGMTGGIPLEDRFDALVSV